MRFFSHKNLLAACGFPKQHYSLMLIHVYGVIHGIIMCIPVKSWFHVKIKTIQMYTWLFISSNIFFGTQKLCRLFVNPFLTAIFSFSTKISTIRGTAGTYFHVQGGPCLQCIHNINENSEYFLLFCPILNWWITNEIWKKN